MQADALVDLAESLRLLNRGGEIRSILREAITLYERKGTSSRRPPLRRW
jgi:hypothetical protein